MDYYQFWKHIVAAAQYCRRLNPDTPISVKRFSISACRPRLVKIRLKSIAVISIHTYFLHWIYSMKRSKKNKISGKMKIKALQRPALGRVNEIHLQLIDWFSFHWYTMGCDVKKAQIIPGKSDPNLMATCFRCPVGYY